MTFGISDTGFELKLISDIISDKRQLAAELFQDLVEEGDIVDTSASSALGILINLSSLAISEVWEQTQLSYSSLDPNTALGVALDNIVQYGGIARFKPSYSIVTGVFTGDNGTLLDTGQIVGANTHANTFATTSPIYISPNTAVGIILSVFAVQNSTDYTIDYTIGSSTNTVTYTSDSDATEEEIYAGLLSQIISAHPLLNAEIVTDGLSVEKDDIFSASDFSVSSNLTINTCSNLGNLKAEDIGVKEAEANSLIVIKTPVLGWDSVYNPLAASTGSDTETDEELRIRFRNTKFERSSNILDSLYSALNNLDNVQSVTVYENDTDSVDSNGLPPHSFMAVVLGGLSETIAETIWLNKPAGISSEGDTTIAIVDSQGFERDINFQRPTPIPIYIDIDITTFEDFPADGIELIKSAIVSYSATEFLVGDDIIYSRLYTPINSVIGHQVNSLYIDTSALPLGTANIPIAFTEIGSFSSVNINVTTS